MKKGNSRRMISTYPFKYTYTSSESFFECDNAALYIHIPFCLRRCTYCSYVTSTKTTSQQREEYVQALCDEIRMFSSISCYPNYTIEALYVGGGTPSTLNEKQLSQVVKTCRECFEFTDDAEWCIEFDPSHATEKKVEHVLKLGFNRLSFGVQTFDDDILAHCNRSHNRETVFRAVDVLNKFSFGNFNLDLIYPLKGLTGELWKETLEQTVSLKPAAITAHVLEIWPGTGYDKLLSNNDIELSKFDQEIEMGQFAYDFLESRGFKRWSTCGYYNPEQTRHYSQFMDYYWMTKPMIGFGVSAKSVMDLRVYKNIDSRDEYVDKIQRGELPIDFSTTMTKRQEMHRVMIRGFKRCQVDKSYFLQRFGVTINQVFRDELKYLVDKGWLAENDDDVSLTRLGQLYDRDVYSVFYTEDDLSKVKDGEVFFGLSLPTD